MSLWPQDIEETVRTVIADFSGKDLLVATAESCTAGLIAGAITEVSGSSAIFDRGFVTYSNQAKQDMLGVSATTLEAHGAVSRPTALEMAEGAVRNSAAHIAVAVTGIAGPGGGTTEKPVGLVHLACARKGHETLHREMRYGAIGRSEVRLATVRTALEMLIEMSGR